MAAPPAAAPRLIDPDDDAQRASARADFVWAGVIVGALGLTLALVKLLPRMAGPLLAALIVAYALDPLAERLSRGSISRARAVAGLFAAFVVVFGGLAVFLVPALITQAAKLPAYLEGFTQIAVARIEAALGQPLPADWKAAASLFSGKLSGVLPQVLPDVADFAGKALGGTASFLGFLGSLVLVPVIAFYFLRDYRRITASFSDLIPRRHAEQVNGRFREVDRVLGAFVRGQLTVALTLSLVYSALLSAVGLELAITVALVTGIGNLAPYLGTVLGFSLATVLALSFGNAWMLAKVALVYTVVVTMDTVLITPRVLGDRVGLSPVAVILAVLSFGQLFGFAGVLFAVPATAVLKVVVGVLVARYRETRLYRSAAQPAP